MSSLHCFHQCQQLANTYLPSCLETNASMMHLIFNLIKQLFQVLLDLQSLLAHFNTQNNLFAGCAIFV